MWRSHKLNIRPAFLVCNGLKAVTMQLCNDRAVKGLVAFPALVLDPPDAAGGWLSDGLA